MNNIPDKVVPNNNAPSTGAARNDDYRPPPVSGASKKSSVVSYADSDTADPDAVTIVPFKTPDPTTTAATAADPNTILSYLLLPRSNTGGAYPSPITVTFEPIIANAVGDEVLNANDPQATHIKLVPTIDPNHANALNNLRVLTNSETVAALAGRIGAAKDALNAGLPDQAGPEGLRGGKKSKSKKHAKSKKQEKRKSVRRR